MNVLMRCVLVATVFFITACSTSPTGRSQFLFYSPNTLDKMGAQAFAELKKQEPESKDAAVNQYVRCVATDTLSGLQGSRGNPAHWEVVVFENDEANAFALPGGKIGVYTGMLTVAKTQDQLAAVIGHEIAHVIAQHSNERMSTNAATQVGLTAAGSSGVSPDMQALLGMGAQYGVLLPYGRTQESEADIMGLDIMARAGFNPEASIDVWKNMAEKYGKQPPEFLQTHPSHGTRISDLNSDMPHALTLYHAARAKGIIPKCSL